MRRQHLYYALGLLAAVAAGYFLHAKLEPAPQGATDPATRNAGAEREILYWVAPMDPNYRRDKPGKSPMGMDLVPVYADEASSGDTVSIAPSVAHNLGLRTEAVDRGPLWRLIRAQGQVAIDQAATSQINTYVEGWLEELAVDAAGDPVQAGQLLARLYSPRLVAAQRELLAAMDRGEPSLISAAVERLQALGMRTDDVTRLQRERRVQRTVALRAPRDGIITGIFVQEGAQVTPGTTLLRIADFSRVWVEADVFSQQAAWVQAGQAAEVTFEALPGEVFEGEVSLVDARLNPSARTVRVRIVLDNAAGQLREGMFGEVKIYGGAKRGVLSVPAEAVIRGAEADRLVVQLAPGEFEVREVRLGLRSGDWVEVIEGVNQGEEVVVSAQFLIDSEASLAGSIRRLGEARREAPSWSLTGTLLEMDAEAATARIAHDPVPALDWPAMTMSFKLSDSALTTQIEAGEPIRFTMVRTPAGYEVTDLERTQ